MARCGWSRPSTIDCSRCRSWWCLTPRPLGKLAWPGWRVSVISTATMTTAQRVVTRARPPSRVRGGTTENDALLRGFFASLRFQEVQVTVRDLHDLVERLRALGDAGLSDFGETSRGPRHPADPDPALG